MLYKIEEFLSYTVTELRQSMAYAVVGMSGGADSTLVAIVCREALGPDRVHTLHLPMHDRDRETFNHLSWEIAGRLGVHRYMLPIGPTTTSLNHSLETVLVRPLKRTNAGNSRSRVRMAMLYGFARAIEDETGEPTRVIGTGNLSEDYIGYDTKGGDSLADIFPIGDLFKSEVYQLLEYFRDRGLITEGMINRVPSAGLWEDQTDESELGFTYAQMEGAIRQLHLGESNPCPQNVLEFVAARHKAHKHKHLAPYVVPARSFCV